MPERNGFRRWVMGVVSVLFVAAVVGLIGLAGQVREESGVNDAQERRIQRTEEQVGGIGDQLHKIDKELSNQGIVLRGIADKLDAKVKGEER